MNASQSIRLVGEQSPQPSQSDTDYADSVRLGLWLLGLGMGGLPVLIALDEPNAQLGEVGDPPLLQDFPHMCEEGRTVVVVTQRANLLTATDVVLAPGAAPVCDPNRERVKPLVGATTCTDINAGEPARELA